MDYLIDIYINFKLIKQSTQVKPSEREQQIGINHKAEILINLWIYYRLMGVSTPRSEVN